MSTDGVVYVKTEPNQKRILDQWHECPQHGRESCTGSKLSRNGVDWVHTCSNLISRYTFSWKSTAKYFKPLVRGRRKHWNKQ